MHRTFASRIRLAHLLALLLLAAATFWCGWHKVGFGLLLGLILLALMIERIIHCAYIVGPAEIVVHTSRFTTDRRISLSSIQRIDRIRLSPLPWLHRSTALVVVYTSDGGQEQSLSITPACEDEFVAYVAKKRQQLDAEDAD